MRRLNFGTRFFLVFLLIGTTFTATSHFQKANAATAGTGACTQTVGSSAGVVVTTSGSDCIVKFTSTGSNTWRVPAGVTSVRTLIVAGGGGGGAWVGGGGGGGGFRDISSVSVTAGSDISLSVGAGGTGAISSGGQYNSNVGSDGGDSSFGSYTSDGGGKGASHFPSAAWDSAVVRATAGGSGGGGTGSYNISNNVVWDALRTPGNGNKSATSPSQGYAGGAGLVGASIWAAGGGGGAGGAGGIATSASGGTGGTGASSNITGSSVTYAGGGGGATYSSANFGSGGSGGGGNGGVASGDSGTGASGTANTGGGGGGGTTTVNSSTGGTGGSGVVIVRYSASVLPTFGTPSPTGNGFTVQITNYDANYTWTGTATASGSVSVSNTGLVIVTGVAANTSSTATVTTSRSGYATVSSTVAATSLYAVTNGSCTAAVNTTSGVAVYDSGTRCFVAFKNTGTSYTWTPPSGISTINLLTVAGGGGGGSRAGGGGGAGGVILQTDQSVNPTNSVSVSVGAGGAGAPNTRSAGSRGGNSSVVISGTTFTALGGGGGADPGLGAATTGGSGGGGTGTPYAAAAGTAGQGYGGGSGLAGNCASAWCGGGGGGGAAIGGNASGTTSGTGGIGITVPWITKSVADALVVGDRSNGTSAYFAGGGSGGGGAGTTSGAGGLGGGAAGVTNTLTDTPLPGIANTGGGGGGGGYTVISSGQSAAGSGGSGVVLISWSNALSITFASGTGGTGADQEKIKNLGVNLVLPRGVEANSWFTKSGFNIVGWSSTNGGTKNYDLGGSYSTDSATTLYPVWAANQYANFTSSTPGGASATGKSFRAATAGIADKTSFTAEAWFFDKAGASGQNPIISQGANTANSFTVMTQNGTGTAGTRNLSFLFTGFSGSITNVSTNTWHHVAITRSGSTYVVYLDGAQAATGTVTGDTATGGSFLIGENAYYMSAGTGHFFHGYIDQVKVWNSALTANQVKTSMHTYADSGITGPTLVHLYDFNDSPASTLIDQVGTFNLTATGSGSVSYSSFALTATFDSNSGSAVDSSTFHNYNLIQEPTAPNRSNYTFAGWSSTLNDSSTLISFPYAPWPFANKTLYALWTSNNVDVTFNSNYGTPTTSTQSIVKSTATALTSNTFTRTGYSFAGWNSAANGSGTDYTNGQSVTITGAMTLYAKWTADTYAVTYNSDGGTAVSNGSYTVGGSALTFPSATKVGMLLQGWFKDALKTIFAGRAGATYTPSATETLYAAWTNLLINLDGSTTTSLPNTGANWTSILPGSSSAVGTPTGNATYFTSGGISGVTLDGAADSYSFGANVGNTPGEMTVLTWVNPGNLHTGVSTPWNIIASRWFSNASGGGTSADQDWHYALKWDSTTSTIKQNLYSNTNSDVYGLSTFPATGADKWYLVGFTINGSNQLQFYVNGKPDGSPISFSHADNSTAILYIGDPRTSGAAGFVGKVSKFQIYNKALSASEIVSAYSTDGGSFAHPTVTFNANDGSGSPATATQVVANGISTTLNSNTFTRTGYVFNGWTTAANGTGTSYTDAQAVTLTTATTLYAKWTLDNQTVTFNSNYTGGPSSTTQTVSGNTATALTSNTFTRTGYSFAGWNSAANGSGTDYTNGQSVTITGALTLYAKWTANSNTVTFNSNYGTPTTSTQSITSGTATALTSNTFTRTGYSFAGWNTAANGSGTDYTNGQSVTITGALTLYAKWTANSNTVTFNSNYGTPTTSTQSITSGSSTALTSNSFTRTGFNFAGWNTLADGSGTAYTNGASVTIYAALTLYAQWTEINYTVTYNVNGGSGTPERSTDIYGITTGAITLPAVGSMTRTGYKFEGWSTTNNGTALSGTYTPTANVTLYAVWSAKSYAITYFETSKTGGSAPSAGSYTTGGSAATVSNAGTLERTGYTFAGWNTAIDGTGTSYVAGDSLSPTAPVNLYPKWSAVAYRITYSNQNSTGGSVPTDTTDYNIGNNAVIKANVNNLARTGYTFTGWTVAQDNSGTLLQSGATYTFGSASITLYPKWSANTYTISYNSNGATTDTRSTTSETYTSGNSGISLPNNASADMLRTGYTFTGWATTPTGTVLSGSSATSYTTAADVTLYAIWTKKSITYQYNRGMINAVSMTSSEVGTFPSTGATTAYFNSTVTFSSTISSTITYAGNSYKFFGWTDGNTTYQPGNTFAIDANVIDNASPIPFSAQWIRLFNVRYALNGGTGVVDIDDQCDAVTHVCTDGQVIALNSAPTRDGYDFTGWKDQSNADFAAGASATVTANSYLYYAQWTARNYNISFDSIGGSNSPATVVKNIGNSVTLPSPGTRTGYDFAGWTLGGVTYGEGTTFTVGTSNAAFTALWNAKRFNVSYDWNGGVGTPTSPSIYTYGQAAITLPTGAGHSKDGYVFDGWALTAGGTKLGTTDIPTGDVQYVARWIDGAYRITFDTVGGTLSQTTVDVTRASSTTLPTPTRAGYSFNGWYEDSGATQLYGNASATVTPTTSKTVYAKWIQNSLEGINPAHLNELASVTTQSGSQGTMSATHSASGTGASVVVPADALPAGTVVKLSFVEDLTRPKNLINSTYAYFTSAVLHWQSGTGASATVPTAASGKPLVLTLTNPDIRSGAKIYKIVKGVATEVATATQDGSVAISIYDDPEIVIAATTPTAPLSVSAIGNLNAKSTVSWTAPASSGGSAISGYTVTASPGGATCTTTGATSCAVSGLTNDTNYTFTVKATNAVGDSVFSSASNSVIPRLLPTFNAVFNSKGGSAVSDSLFTQPGTLSEPTAPTRSGFTFGGWLSQDGITSSAVTFPYSPGVNSDVTLYANWIANTSTGSPSTGGTPSNSAPVNTVTPRTGSPSTVDRAPLINMPVAPSAYSAPATQFTELRNAPYPTNGLNVPLVGEVITLVNRQPVQTKVTTVEANTLIEFGQTLSMTLTPQTVEGKPVAPTASGVVSVVKGGTIEATGVGFKPGSPVEAWMYSEPVRLGDGIALADGTFQSTFSISSTAPLGKHTVVLNGLTQTNEIVTVALGVQVVKAEEVNALPNTKPGQSALDSALVAAGTAAFAAVLLTILVLAIRRRRSF